MLTVKMGKAGFRFDSFSRLKESLGARVAGKALTQIRSAGRRIPLTPQTDKEEFDIDLKDFTFCTEVADLVGSDEIAAHFGKELLWAVYKKNLPIGWITGDTTVEELISTMGNLREVLKTDGVLVIADTDDPVTKTIYRATEHSCEGGGFSRHGH